MFFFVIESHGFKLIVRIFLEHKLFLIFSLILILTFCGKSSLSKEKFIHWVEDYENGLLVEQSYKNCLFKLQYKPAGYLILKENKNEALNTKSYSTAMSEVGNLFYFNFSISSMDGVKDVLKEGISDDLSYTQRLDYFSYGAQNDLKLIIGKDTLACVLYHFERSYALSPYNTLVLGFEKGKRLNEPVQKDDLIVSFNDRVFGAGRILMKIKAKDIANMPDVIVNEILLKP